MKPKKATISNGFESTQTVNSSMLHFLLDAVYNIPSHFIDVVKEEAVSQHNNAHTVGNFTNTKTEEEKNKVKSLLEI